MRGIFRREKAKHLLVACGLGLLATALVFVVHRNRDLLFEWDWVKPVGPFTAAPNPALEQAALTFLEKSSAQPGQVCVGNWVGHDNRYVYMAAGCARFFEQLGEIRTEGDGNYHATRFRYEGDQIEHFEQPDETEFNNSLRRLFPREAAHLVMVRMNETEFRQKGLAKMENGK